MSGALTRERSAFRVVGRAVPRHDARDKVLGQIQYAAEWQMPGMLHAKVLRSPHPHARILGIDTGAAERLPGVAAVLTAKDVPNNVLWTDVPGQTTEVGRLKARMNVLAEDKVRYEGEAVALVAAETEEIAAEALRLVEVRYEPLPVVSDPLEALQPGSPLVHEEQDSNRLTTWRVHRGDVEAGMRGADLVIENVYRTPIQDHAYLEPEAGVAWIDAGGVVTIRCATQVIEHFRSVARVLNVPESMVRIIGTYVGGGFGGREDVTVEVFLGLLAYKLRRPVRMVWSRSESLVARVKRHPYWMRYRTGVMRDGTLVAQDIELISDAGAYAYLSALVLMYSVTNACGPYRVPNARIAATAVYTNNPPNSAFRGFGAMQMAVGYELQMEAIARALDIDPVEVRKRNFIREGDVHAIGQVQETYVALPEAIDRVKAALGPPSRPSAPWKRIGRAVACNMQSYGRIVWLNDWSSAWVGFEMDGSVVIRCGVPDIGGGQAASLCQIASEVLGVPLERVYVHISDSALTPLAGTTTATRQLMMSGNAVLLACHELRSKVLRTAAVLLGVGPDALDMADGHVVVSAEPDRRVPIPAVLGRMAREGVPRGNLSVFQTAGGEPWAEETGQGKVFPDFTFGSHAAEVEVDLETGETRLLKYVACHDVGRAINPQSVEGQIEGGAVQGLGFAMMEAVVLQEARSLTPNLTNYLIPTSLDVPDIQSIVLESGEGVGPFRARGIGEPPIGPPGPCIAAAVANAIGAPIRELPVTPERVLRAIRSRKG